MNRLHLIPRTKLKHRKQPNFKIYTKTLFRRHKKEKYNANPDEPQFPPTQTSLKEAQEYAEQKRGDSRLLFAQIGGAAALAKQIVAKIEKQKGKSEDSERLKAMSVMDTEALENDPLNDLIIENSIPLPISDEEIIKVTLKEIGDKSDLTMRLLLYQLLSTTTNELINSPSFETFRQEKDYAALLDQIPIALATISEESEIRKTGYAPELFIYR